MTHKPQAEFQEDLWSLTEKEAQILRKTMTAVIYFLLENQIQLDLERCSVASWKFRSRIQKRNQNWRGRYGVIYTEVLLKIVHENTSQGIWLYREWRLGINWALKYDRLAEFSAPPLYVSAVQRHHCGEPEKEYTGKKQKDHLATSVAISVRLYQLL